MKISLVFALLLAFLQSEAQTSVYHPFPTSNAFWIEGSSGYQCSCCASYHYEITGDTVINSIIYHKIWKKGKAYLDDNSGFCSFDFAGYIDSYVGAIREDIINKKVYSIYDSINGESLLYDFDLSLGDTLTFGSNPDNVITEIDSILIGNSYRNRYAVTLNGGTYVYLIEGIGSTHGLFGELDVPFEFGTYLSCFVEGGQTVYPNSTSNCDTVVGTNLIEKHDEFKFNPNPFSTETRITRPNGIRNSSVHLYDVYGRLVHEVQLDNRVTILRRGILSKGIYFYRVIHGNQAIVSGSLIIY